MTVVGESCSFGETSELKGGMQWGSVVEKSSVTVVPAQASSLGLKQSDDFTQRLTKAVHLSDLMGC